MSNSLYVDFDGLEGDIRMLENWKKGFDGLNTSINNQITEMNNLWVGEDYNSMKANIQKELTKITGPEGLIQNFVRDRIAEIERKKGNYVAIQRSNVNRWEELS